MIRKVIKYSCIGLGGVLLGTIAIPQAQAINFYLGNGSMTSERERSYSYSGGGIDFTAELSDRPDSQSKVFRKKWGLGVISGRRDNPLVDGRGSSDSLRLSFQKTVRLVSATFSAVNKDDDAIVKSNGSQIFSGNLPIRRGTLSTVSFLNSSTGSTFDFSVLGYDDAYLLKSIQVEHVPEPLTILGSGLALGAGVLFEQKRKRAKKTEAV